MPELPVPVLVAWILAGLAMYFMGMGAIRTNLQRIPGRRFREFIGRATNRPVIAAILGFLMGVITQTSIGVSVILAGLIARGISTLPRALTMVAWANFGLVVLVYLVHQPLHLTGLCLIAISGIYLQFFRNGNLRGLCEPLYALGTVLLGIYLMKTYCPQLVSSPQGQDFLDDYPHWNLLAFLFAVAIRTVIQSTSTVVVLGVILNTTGLFTHDQALMVVFGTGLGTALAAHFLTAHFQGVMRQITLFEAAINAFAGGAMLFLYYIEADFDIPLIKAFATHLPGDTESHVASIFLMQQTLCLVITYATLKWSPGWLEKLSPTTKEQDLSRPRFISDEATQDFETGLALADRELGVLMERLPAYLQTIRPEHKGQITAEPLVLHNASLAILSEMESFLGALSEHGGKAHSASVALLQTQRRLSLVTEIDGCVWDIVQGFRGKPPTGRMQSVEANVIEALDTLLLTGVDALNSGSSDDVELLRLLTAAPGDVVDRLRRNYLREEPALEHAERILILSVLSQYERIVWALQQLSRSLQTIPVPKKASLRA